MNRGKSIMNWSEPITWNKAARNLAKEEGVSSFPWLNWIGLLFLVGGFIVWEWSAADPSSRANIPKLIVIIATLFSFLLGVGWLYVRLNLTNSTTIYERGILHGSKLKKLWIPWEKIECFNTDEDSIGSLTFRFLNWQQEGVEDESFSVVPYTVDLEAVIQHFKTNHIEQDTTPTH